MSKLIKYSILSILFVVVSGFITFGSAQTSNDAIRQMLDERNEQIKALLGPEGTDYTQQQREELKDIINEVIDYRSMAQYALQDTWSTLSSSEQQDFVDLFAQIVRDHSLTNLDIYRSEVTYESIEVDGDSAKVVTMATMGRVRTPVTYNLAWNDTAGEWVVVDLIIDNVSTAKSYKRQFQDIISSDGYDYLVSTLQDRVSE